MAAAIIRETRDERANAVVDAFADAGSLAIDLYRVPPRAALVAALETGLTACDAAYWLVARAALSAELVTLDRAPVRAAKAQRSGGLRQAMGCDNIRCMRTTLDIADDVLRAARELARREHKTIGEAISDLARRALNAVPEGPSAREPEAVYGFRPFPSRGGIVTNEAIDTIRDDEAA